MRIAWSGFAVVCLLLIAYALVAQEPGNVAPVVKEAGGKTAPISWEYYQLPSRKLSVMLPKLPNQITLDEPCMQVQGSLYQVYAENAVYEFRFYAKDPEPFPPICTRKTLFSKSYLLARLSDLQQTNPAPVSVSSVDIGPRKATTFRWETKTEIATRWIFDDFTNDRWVELSINRRKDATVDEARFLNSLKFADAIGKDMGTGSPITLGDMITSNSTQVRPNGSVADEPLIIVNKYHASYPAAARESDTQGTVRLKVEFLANGAIGQISVTSGLPNGLTEAALSSARRLAFLPKRANGVAVNETKDVNYGFWIY